MAAHNAEMIKARLQTHTLNMILKIWLELPMAINTTIQKANMLETILELSYAARITKILNKIHEIIFPAVAAQDAEEAIRLHRQNSSRDAVTSMVVGTAIRRPCTMACILR